MKVDYVKVCVSVSCCVVMTTLFTRCACVCVCVCVCVCCSQTGTTVYRMVLAHPLALCEIQTIELRNTGARFYRQGEIHVKSVCVSEFPSLRCSIYIGPSEHDVHTHAVLFKPPRLLVVDFILL